MVIDMIEIKLLVDDIDYEKTCLLYTSDAADEL